MPGIAYIDHDASVVCLDNGETAPITNFFDILGEDCEACHAVAVVAGPFSIGWLSIDLTQFDERTIH